ncbi:MAG: Fe-S cluster assembly protein SufD [Isosphaeraceae bacterium]
MTSSATLKTSAAGGFGEKGFEAFLKGRDEPNWLFDRRKKAFEALKAANLPTMRDEEWRRTDIRALKLDQFAPPINDEASIEARNALAEAHRTLDKSYVTGCVHVNSVLTETPDPTKLGGATFVDLNRAVKDHPDLLKRFLMSESAYPLREDLFSSLHAAFWTGGTLLYVPKGVKVAAPLYELVGLADAGKVDMSHCLIVLEEGSEATFVRETIGASREQSQALHVGAVEIFVGAGAKLRFVNIQNWDDRTWHFSRERAQVDREGAIQWTVGALGSRLSKVNQDVALAGEAARAQVNGVMFTSGRQHLAYFTRQDHQAPHATSDLLYKGGLKDSSRIVWKGMIRVEKEAQKTDAYQKNDSLLLSQAARADSIPGLEIEANDVRCTHGATAGQVDEDMVFYLRSRGIARETAVRLIVEGFFAKVHDRITLEPVRDALRDAVARKLHGGGSALQADGEIEIEEA